MLRVIEHGLAAAGRYLRFTVRCADRPGQLALLLDLIAEQRANVIDVEHQRHDPRLRLGRGARSSCRWRPAAPEHSDRLVERAAGDGRLRGDVLQPRPAI